MKKFEISKLARWWVVVVLLFLVSEGIAAGKSFRGIKIYSTDCCCGSFGDGFTKKEKAMTPNTHHHTIAEVELHYKTFVKPQDRVSISNSMDSANALRQVFSPNQIEHHEMIYVMCMNRANQVLGTMKISEGGLSSSICDVKLIFQAALRLNASSLILSHNHPSGQLKPSEHDIALTKKVKEGCKVLDFSLLDHVILTADSYYSFADNGIL